MKSIGLHRGLIFKEKTKMTVTTVTKEAVRKHIPRRDKKCSKLKREKKMEIVKKKRLPQNISWGKKSSRKMAE